MRCGVPCSALIGTSCTANRGFIRSTRLSGGGWRCWPPPPNWSGSARPASNLFATSPRQSPPPGMVWRPILPKNVRNPFARQPKRVEERMMVATDLVVFAVGLVSNDALYPSLRREARPHRTYPQHRRFVSGRPDLRRRKVAHATASALSVARLSVLGAVGHAGAAKCSSGRRSNCGIGVPPYGAPMLMFGQTNGVCSMKSAVMSKGSPPSSSSSPISKLACNPGTCRGSSRGRRTNPATRSPPVTPRAPNFAPNALQDSMPGQAPANEHCIRKGLRRSRVHAPDRPARRPCEYRSSDRGS